MAPAVVGLVAAMASLPLALGLGPPPAELVAAIVGRVVETDARALAARRGLRAGKPIGVRVLGRGRLQAERGARGLDATAPDAGAAEAYLRATLGLDEPAGGNPEATPLSSPTPVRPFEPVDVSGFYDASAGVIVVGDWIDLAGERIALDRDIAQALLDRRFELGRWLGARSRRAGLPPSSDARLARLALIEGDATVQALEERDPALGVPPPRALAAAISATRAAIEDESAGARRLDVARRMLVELDGLSFVAGVRARAPWSAVNALWARAPSSSEQILHPQKYERRDAPDDVGARLSGALPRGWQIDYDDTLGEIGARVFLDRAVDGYLAERGAAGWGGDRALVLRKTGGGVGAGGDGGDVAKPAGDARRFVAWVTTWDDVTDAEDFAALASRALAALAGAPGVPEPAAGRLCLLDAQGRVYALERKNSAVGLLVAAPADAEAILGRLVSAAGGRAHPRPTRHEGHHHHAR